MWRSEPQLAVEVTLITASVASSIFGSSTSSTRTSRGPCQTAAFILASFPSSRCASGPRPRTGRNGLERLSPGSGDEGDHFALDFQPLLGADPPVGAGARADRVAVAEAVEDAGVDVGGAADRRGVAERLGDLVDGAGDGALGGGFGAGPLLAGEGDRGEDGPVPGAKILRRELLADLLVDVLVDLVGADVDPLASGAVGEQVLGAAAAAVHRLDRAAGGGVADRLHPALAARGREVEDDLAALDRDVVAAHRGEAVALVFLGVDLAADAEETEVEKADGAGERPLARHPLAAQVGGDGAAQLRQREGELPHQLELPFRLPLLPALVVEVLLAPGFVVPRRLDVAEGVGADPDLLPGRRDRQLPDPLQRLLVGDLLAGPVLVGEAATAAHAPDPRPRTVGAAQATAAGGRLDGAHAAPCGARGAAFIELPLQRGAPSVQPRQSQRPATQAPKYRKPQ